MRGGSDAPDITTLRLPGIGWVLQWRGDGFWRELSDLQYQDELNGVHMADDEEWVGWSGLSQPQARGGTWTVFRRGGSSTGNFPPARLPPLTSLTARGHRFWYSAASGHANGTSAPSR